MIASIGRTILAAQSWPTMNLAELARSLAGPFNDDYNQFHSCYQCHGSPLGKVYVNTPWPALCFDVDNEVVYLKQDLKLNHRSWFQATPGFVNDPVFDNLAHYWSADEASGNARADSKDSIDLLETGGVVNSAAGKEGNAANYNVAGHYLRMASQIGFGGIHAVSFWINIRTLPGVGDVVSLLSDGFGNDYCQLDHSGNVNFQDDLILGGVDPVISQPLGSLNTWHFVVVGADPVAMVEYISVDGAAYTTADVSLGSTGTGFQSDDVFAFGSPPNAVPDGLFDEIAAWTPSLTQANVTTLWNGGAGKFYRP